MSGLLALLDDVAAIVKLTATQIDDVVGQTAKVGAKVSATVLDDAAKAVEETFGDTTIADLIHVPRHRKPLCRFPAVPKSTS